MSIRPQQTEHLLRLLLSRRKPFPFPRGIPAVGRPKKRKNKEKMKFLPQAVIGGFDPTKAPLANLCPQRIWSRLPTEQLASYPLRKPPMKFLPLAVIGGFPPPRCQKSRADSSTTVQPEKTNRLTSNQFILFLNLNLVLWTASHSFTYHCSHQHTANDILQLFSISQSNIGKLYHQL